MPHWRRGVWWRRYRQRRRPRSPGERPHHVTQQLHPRLVVQCRAFMSASGFHSRWAERPALSVRTATLCWHKRGEVRHARPLAGVVANLSAAGGISKISERKLQAARRSFFGAAFFGSRGTQLAVSHSCDGLRVANGLSPSPTLPSATEHASRRHVSSNLLRIFLFLRPSSHLPLPPPPSTGIGFSCYHGRRRSGEEGEDGGARRGQDRQRHRFCSE